MKKIFIIFIIFNILFAGSPLSEKDILKAIGQGVDSTKNLLNYIPINYRGERGDTLLHYAVRLRKLDVIRYLVRQKIPLSIRGGKFYGTALEDAIYYGYLEIANYLIEEGTYLNIRDKYGKTALHIAAEKGLLNIVEKLLANGASKTIVDNDGHIPYDLIPMLSWDSQKKLKELLKVDNFLKINSKSNFSSNFFYEEENEHKFGGKKNRVINIIDKRSTIKNSDIGVFIETYE